MMCRNNNYYVDSNSLSEIELGTIEYPYKQIITPFREIFNYQNLSAATTQRIVNIKGNTENIINTFIDPLIVIAQFDIIVKTYNAENETGRAIIIGSDVNISLPVLGQSTNYFPMLSGMKNYNYQRYIDAGLYSQTNAGATYSKVVMIASNLTFDNVQIQTYSLNSNSLTFISNSGYSILSFLNCKLDNWDNYLYYTDNAQGVIVRNNHITLRGQSYGFLLGNQVLDLTCGCYKCKQFMTFENNTIVQMESTALSETFIYYKGFGHFIFRNNLFLGVTFNIATKPQFQYETTLRTCNEQVEYLFHVENNTFDSSIAQNGQLQFAAYTFDDVPHQNETFEIIVKNNSFMNIISAKTIFPFIMNFNCSMLFENNKFINTSISVSTNYLIKMSSKNASVLLQNNSFEDSLIDQGISIQAKYSNFLNNNFSGIRYSSSPKQSGLIQAIQSNELTISNLIVSNVYIINSNLILVQSCKSIMFSSISIDNVTSTSKDLILLNAYQNCSISNFHVSNLSIVEPSSSLFSLSDIPTNSIFIMSESSLNNSAAPYITLQNIVIQNADQPVHFTLSTISISNSKTITSTGFINIGPINYEKFHIILTNLSVFNTQSLNSFLVSQMNGNIVLSSSNVAQSTGQFAILKPFQSVEPPLNVLIVQNCTMSENFGSESALLVAQTNSVIYINDSIFIGNYGVGRGSVAFADRKKSSIFIFNCSFTANYGILGGVLYAHIESTIDCEQCHFQSNFAYIGGVAYINDDGKINMKNSSFTNNSALVGNIVYIINSEQQNTLESLSLSNNNFNIANSKGELVYQILKNSSGLYDLFNSAFVKGLQAQHHLDQLSEQLDYSVCIMRAELTVSNTVSFSNENVFIQAQAGAFLKLNNFRLENQQLNCLIQSAFSTISISNMTARNISFGGLTSQFLLKIQVGCTLSISQSTFVHVEMPLLEIISSEIVINQVTFQDFSVENVYISIESTYGEINNLDLTDAKASALAIMDITSCQIRFTELNINETGRRLIKSTLSKLYFENIQYKNNQLENQTTQKGGSFILSTSSEVSIVNSEFTNNTATNLWGGVIFAERRLSENPFLIRDSKFIKNRALSGGAVYIQDSRLNILRSQFDSNGASQNGGALQLSCPSLSKNDCKTMLQSSLFKNNSAMSQGGAVSYDFESPEIETLEFLENRAPYGNDLASFPVKIRCDQAKAFVESGQIVQKGDFIFSLLDQNDQVVLNQDIMLKTYLVSGDSSLNGQAQFISENGIFNLSSFSLIGLPGKSELLYFSLPELKSVKVLAILGSKFTDYQQNLTFSDCIRGEILKDFKCVECLPNKYSFLTKQAVCHNCPLNAYCPGGDQLLVNPGYWRGNSSTDYIIQCLVSDACPGGGNLTCSYGYKGVLCNECIGQTTNGFYARSQNGGCAKCREYWIEYLILTAIFFGLLIYIFGMVAMIVRNPSRSKDSSVLMRILTNYLQIVELVSQLQLNWPDNIRSFLNNLSIFSSSISKIFNIGCLIKTNFSDNLSFYVIEQITLALMPIAFLVFACIIWKIASLLLPNRFRQDYKRNIFPTLFVFMFLIYPTLVQKCFQMIQCIDIDGIYYLKKDLTLICWSSSHKLIVLAVGLPIFMIWVVGFPSTIMVILTKHRNRLDDPDFIIKYGIFYVGLRDNSYYWEVLVINLRKIICSVLAMSMTKENSYKLVITFVLIMILNQQLNKHLSPYNNEMLNTIESNSMFVGILVILNGTLFLHPTQANEDKIQLGIFIVLIVLNILFLIHWMTLICIIFGKTMKKYAISKVNEDDVPVVEMSEEEKDKIYKEMLGIERSPKLKIVSAEKEMAKINKSILEQQTASGFVSQKSRATILQNSTFFPIKILEGKRNLDLIGFEESKEGVMLDDFEFGEKKKRRVSRKKKKQAPAESIQSNDEFQ